jgi:hypothetical protein
MKQIKTIQNNNPVKFDENVNGALQEGWTITRRYYNHGNFIAELETEVITEDEKCCENCAHYSKSPAKEPCLSCGDDADKWEPAT